MTFTQTIFARGRTQHTSFASQASNNAIFKIDTKERPRLFALVLFDWNRRQFGRVHSFVARLSLTSVLKPRLNRRATK